MLVGEGYPQYVFTILLPVVSPLYSGIVKVWPSQAAAKCVSPLGYVDNPH